MLFYNNDSNRGTGGLGAGQQETDDRGRAQLKLFAAIHLFAATGDATYRDYIDTRYVDEPMFAQWFVSPFNSGSVRNLLHYASLPGATASVASAIRTRFLDLWARSDYGGWGALDAQTDPYRAYLSDYTWGSNGAKALAGSLFNEESYHGISRHAADQVANAAADYLHYLHGVNPLGKVYLTNMNSFGAENSANEMFHSWFVDGSAKWDSAATSTHGPAPGLRDRRPELRPVRLGRALPRHLAEVRLDPAVAALRAAAAEVLPRLQRRLAPELLADHRAVERLPDGLHPPAGAFRQVSIR